MVYWIFGYYYVCGNGNFFRVSRRTYTDILNRICNSDHRKICIACNFCQFRICRFYNCYNFLLTGNCNDKSKSVYYDDAITFAYDGRTKDLYGTGDNSVLKIASAEYEEPKGTAPVIEGVENGGNYYATQKITVRDADNDLASVTVNGKQEAGTEISLSADNQNNRKKEYTIIAEDRRGNSTSCKITINPCSDLQKRISHLSVDTVKVTDRALVQNTLKDAVTAVENAAEEEKTILAEVKTKCETLLAIYTHAAWEYIHANRPAKSPGVLENPPQPNKFYPISTQGDYTPQKSSGNMSSSSSKSMVSSSDTSTHSMFSFPLIAHEYISAAAREENTSCIGSPFSNQ